MRSDAGEWIELGSARGVVYAIALLMVTAIVLTGFSGSTGVYQQDCGSEVTYGGGAVTSIGDVSCEDVTIVLINDLNGLQGTISSPLPPAPPGGVCGEGISSSLTCLIENIPLLGTFAQVAATIGYAILVIEFYFTYMFSVLVFLVVAYALVSAILFSINIYLGLAYQLVFFAAIASYVHGMV